MTIISTFEPTDTKAEPSPLDSALLDRLYERFTPEGDWRSIDTGSSQRIANDGVACFDDPELVAAYSGR